MRKIFIAFCLIFAYSPAHAVVQSALMGDANLTLSTTTQNIVTTRSLTAPRTIFLPPAAGTLLGQSGASTYYQNCLTFFDQAGGVSSSNTVQFLAVSPDTINGASSLTINAPNLRVTMCPVNGGGWYASIAPQSSIVPSLPLSVANGGTGASTASGISLDNITGFASTGLLNRTGAGAYGFLSLPLSVPNGGTGLTSGTFGGIPYFNSSTTLASSALLPAYAIILGGGTGAAPFALGSLGTTTTVLHGNASGAPTFGAVALPTDVSGILPSSNGGTGLAGTLTGARKANGTGVDTQAACADLSNGTTNCSAAVGQLPGTATNDNAAAGKVGEFLSNSVANTTTNITNATSANAGPTITLTPGDWNVFINVNFLPAATTSISRWICSISSTSNTLDTTNGNATVINIPATVLGGSNESCLVGPVRYSVATNTQLWAIANSSFTVSTQTVGGIISARRIR